MNFLFNWLGSLTVILSLMLLLWVYLYIMENAYPFNPNPKKRMFIANHLWILHIITIILCTIGMYFMFALTDTIGGGY